MAFGLAALAGGQGISVRVLSRETIEKRLGAYTKKNETREPAMKVLFEEAGCKDAAIAEQTVKGVKAPNLVCTLKGSTDSEIIVGAHFDLVERGNGVVDNWSGASLLPSFYQALSELTTRHTFVFVAFTGEERGLLGSRSFVKQLGDEKSRIRAMVNLDTLGLGQTMVWLSHSDEMLARWLSVTSQMMTIPIGVVNVEKIGSSDSESFRERHIPAITIHSLTQKTIPVLHSREDTIAAIRMDDYYQTYKLLCGYLAILDQKLD
jgi:Iap family predicted aminopeptidase